MKGEKEAAAMEMTTEEAFVKVLQRHRIGHAFGIFGSPFMPVSGRSTRCYDLAPIARMRQSVAYQTWDAPAR